MALHNTWATRLTLNNPLAGGDIIAVTAYTNKGDESKLGTPGFVFEDGTKLVNDDLTYPDLGVTTNTAPAKQEYTIPEGDGLCGS